jgi:hypothetical protein
MPQNTAAQAEAFNETAFDADDIRCDTSRAATAHVLARTTVTVGRPDHDRILQEHKRGHRCLTAPATRCWPEAPAAAACSHLTHVGVGANL